MKQLYLLILIGLFLIPTSSFAQVTAGQIDTFDTNTEAWLRGQNVNGELEITADGAGSNGKLVTFNQSQWRGNYISESITAIQFTISNPSNQELHMRLGFGNALNAQSGTWYISTNAIIIAPNTENQSITFPIAQDNLTKISGNDMYNSVMSNVQTLRIFHNSNLSPHGANIEASVNIDNIEAISETSILSNNSQQSFVFYPNPAKTEITLNCTSKCIIEIYDLTGKQHHQQQVSIGDNQIKLSNLISGVYIVRSISQHGIISKRLIIE